MPKNDNATPTANKPRPWQTRHAILTPMDALASVQALLDADPHVGLEKWEEMDDGAKDYLRARVLLAQVYIMDDIRRHLARINETTQQGYVTARLTERGVRVAIRAIKDLPDAMPVGGGSVEEDDETDDETVNPPRRPVAQGTRAPAAPVALPADVPEGSVINAPLVDDGDGFEGAPTADDIAAMEQGGMPGMNDEDDEEVVEERPRPRRRKR